jgi:hypothetical protein
MKKSELQQLIREELRQTIREEIESSKLNDAYDKIINLIRIESRKLSDDDSFELHEKLKKFFNKLL